MRKLLFTMTLGLTAISFAQCGLNLDCQTAQECTYPIDVTAQRLSTNGGAIPIVFTETKEVELSRVIGQVTDSLAVSLTQGNKVLSVPKANVILKRDQTVRNGLPFFEVSFSKNDLESWTVGDATLIVKYSLFIREKDGTEIFESKVPVQLY